MESGFHVLDVTEIGVGVLCTCSGNSSAPSPAGMSTLTPSGATFGDPVTAEIEALSMNHYSDR